MTPVPTDHNGLTARQRQVLNLLDTRGAMNALQLEMAGAGHRVGQVCRALDAKGLVAPTGLHHWRITAEGRALA